MWSYRIGKEEWKPDIKRTLVVLFLLILPACANVEIGRRITSADIAWIQKGITTRAEIVERLGPPMSEGPDYNAMQFQTKTKTKTKTTTTTRKSGESQESESTTTIESVNINQLTRAIYLHTESKGGVFVGIKTTQKQFWVQY
ncbi:MAG: hypothetical protein ACOYXU_11060 [Nitrospirota bacterium]